MVVALEVLLVVLAVLVDAVVVSLLLVMVEIMFFHHAFPVREDTHSAKGWAVSLVLRGCDVADDFDVAEVCDVGILFFFVIFDLGSDQLCARQIMCQANYVHPSKTNYVQGKLCALKQD